MPRREVNTWPRQVALDRGGEVGDHFSHDLDVILASQRLRVEQAPAEREPVARAHDATSGHAREHVDVAEHVQLCEPCEHPEVVERRAEAAAGERQPDASEERGPHAVTLTRK